MHGIYLITMQCYIYIYIYQEKSGLEKKKKETTNYFDVIIILIN